MELSRALVAAWARLIGLSLLAAAATVAATVTAAPRWLVAGAILLLALFKARIILSRYLDLHRAPGWLAGATLVFSIWTLLAFGLYLLPVIMP